MYLYFFSPWENILLLLDIKILFLLTSVSVKESDEQVQERTTHKWY